MKRGGLWLAVFVLTLGLFFGVSALYRLRISRGDVFPEYSSLRADPLGLRALHDAALLLPARDVVRWMRPLERLQAGPGSLVFVAGLQENSEAGLNEEDWTALDRLAIEGARVVVAWHAEAAQPNDNRRMLEIRADPWLLPDEKTAGEKSAKPDASPKPSKSSAEPPARSLHLATQHERRWGFRLGRRQLVQHNGEADAVKGGQAPTMWPAKLTSWRSDLFFIPRSGDGWRVLYRRGSEPVMMDCARGKGWVTVLADSFVLSNEAVQRERATPVLAALFGDAKRIVFVETHLGIEVESGVAVLARRYGLGGAALIALVLAGLWIWRSATPLTPIIEEDEEVRITVAPTAGLEALLRRAVAPEKLFSFCVDAWRPSATAGDQRRLVGAPPPENETDPVAAYNTTTRTLSPKRIP